MPIKRPCKEPGCPKLTLDKSGCCERHKAEQVCGWDISNGGKSSHQRGYGASWRRLRKQILDRDQHLCQVCRKQTATEVDHIIGKADGGTDDPGNLQAICTRCHKKKTARERAEMRRGGGGGQIPTT